MADNDVTKMKVADLKRELKIRGLHTTGNKNELVERLQSALIEGDVFDDNAISEELLDDNDDVLNDDELEEETKKYLSSSGQDEDAMLQSPKGSTSSKSPENLSLGDSSASGATQKKVVLKRKLVTSLSMTENEPTGTSTESKVQKTGDEPSAQTDNGVHAEKSEGTGVVKLNQLSMKERLELRAKKFGAQPSADALKLARAERFGIAAPTTTTTTTTAAATVATAKSEEGKKIEAAPAPAMDLLKKRAERFGGSVSQVMTKLENKEKLQKRQERFGAAAAATGTDTAQTTATPKTPVTTEAANDYAEKAKQRLERFKTAVK